MGTGREGESGEGGGRGRGTGDLLWDGGCDSGLALPVGRLMVDGCW
jgi:hypothetical protein